MTQAVETLKSFEKRDSKVAVAAATNLSFLYNLVQFNSHSSADIIFLDTQGLRFSEQVSVVQMSFQLPN